MTAADLLERRGELEALESAAATALGGEGQLVVVTAEAGLGKTRLVEAALDLAARQGFATAAARASELESDLGWGVAAEVLDQLLGSLSDARRGELLSGRAAPARSVLDGASAGREGARAPNAAELISAMSVVMRRLSEQRPITVAIDDAHWADVSSLRWLASLTARIAGLRALFVIAFRPLEPGAPTELLDSLESSATLALTPRPLSLRATSELVSSGLSASDRESVPRAVHDVTSGNPFLVIELVHHLHGRAVTADAVRRARPERLRSRVIPRVRRLGSVAVALSEAVAVLGVNAALRDAAAVAEVSREEAVRAAEQLTAAGVLSNRLPLNYAHPLLRAVVTESLTAARADLLHRRAASVLLAAGDPEQSAVHLLATEPVGEEWAAQVLAEAGRRALARAAPESAAAFYERALAEPPASVPRDQLLLGRARALLMAGRDDGFPAFREAIAAIPDARDKALIALEMGDALITVDRTLEAQDAYASGVEAIGDRDEPLRIHMLAQAALAALATRGQGERAMAAVVAALEASGRSPELTSRAALALPALVATWTGQPAADCAAMLQRALNAQTYGERPALEWSPDLGWTMASLTWCDAFGHAEPFLDAVIERAQRRVALVDLAVASTWRAYGCLRQGRLAEVERDIAAAAQIYGDIDEAEHALVSALHLDLLVARGHIEPAERVLAQLHVNPEADEIVHLAFLDARARMRIAQGRIAQARQDLEVIAGDISERGFECPGAIPWRSSLAVALHGLGEVEQARALAREDVERCRTFGAPRALGLALLGMGAVADEQEALAALRESVEVLAPSPARLDHARALTALGSCLRRVGQREEALGLLRDALQLASECSADALVLHTQSELKALGTRPRRGWVSGPAALTAAERRVAALAAAGASNGEIAQELVVTLRTVETHLTSIYRKLEIRGRARLAEALEHDGAGAELATSRTGGPSGFTDGRA